MPKRENLTKRERQIMDILYRLGSATAQEIGAALPNPPANATVRKLLSIMENKGLLEHRRVSHSFVYRPRRSAEQASRDALAHTVDTFYRGSLPKAFAALLDVSHNRLSDDDIAELERLIEAAKKEGAGG